MNNALISTALACALLLATGCGGRGGSRKATTNAPTTSAPIATQVATAPATSRAAPFAIQGLRWPGAQAGETLNLWGEGFPSGTPLTVRFTGGAIATATWRSERQVTFDVPLGAQTGDLSLEAGGVVSRGLPFVMWGQGAPSADDHGDTPATATPLPLDQSAAGRVDFARDADYFSLSLSAGQAYWIQTRELKDAMHTQIELFDSSGNSLGLNKRADKLGWGAALLHTASASDTYYLKVTHWRWNATSGEYQVLVQDAAKPRYLPGSENTAPQPLTITTPMGAQIGEVSVSFEATDLDEDDLSAMLSYRAYSPNATEFLPATVTPSTRTSGLRTSNAGPVTHTLTWDSFADVGPVSGQYELQVQLSDGKIVSPLRTTAAFDLQNGAAALAVLSGPSAAVSVTTTANAAPVLGSISTPSAAQTGTVTFFYDVSDAESDTVTIEAYYMLDAVSGFQPATLHVTSAPTQNLTTNPSGLRYRLVWDSAADTGAVSNQPVVFQIRPRDATGIGFGRTSGSFRLTN
jgi:hypothetical protein